MPPLSRFVENVMKEVKAGAESLSDIMGVPVMLSEGIEFEVYVDEQGWLSESSRNKVRFYVSTTPPLPE